MSDGGFAPGIGRRRALPSLKKAAVVVTEPAGAGRGHGVHDGFDGVMRYEDHSFSNSAAAIGRRGRVETLVERGGKTAAPAVHPLGPIEGQYRDAGVANLVQDRVGVAVSRASRSPGEPPQ